MIAPVKCIVPNCSRPAGRTRGVCNACYAYAKRMVKSGDATWKELEELALLRAPVVTRKGNAAFRVALAEARKKPQDTSKR